MAFEEVLDQTILARTAAQVPLTYTPPYLAEKILTSRSALEGERKQVTLLFADLMGPRFPLPHWVRVRGFNETLRTLTPH